MIAVDGCIPTLAPSALGEGGVLPQPLVVRTETIAQCSRRHRAASMAVRMLAPTAARADVGLVSRPSLAYVEGAAV